jgi:hypothetical protein
VAAELLHVTDNTSLHSFSHLDITLPGKSQPVEDQSEFVIIHNLHISQKTTNHRFFTTEIRPKSKFTGLTMKPRFSIMPRTVITILTKEVEHGKPR